MAAPETPLAPRPLLKIESPVEAKTLEVETSLKTLARIPAETPSSTVPEQDDAPLNVLAMKKKKRLLAKQKGEQHQAVSHGDETPKKEEDKEEKTQKEEDKLAIMAAVAMTELFSGSKKPAETPSKSPAETPSKSTSETPSKPAATPALSRKISFAEETKTIVTSDSIEKKRKTTVLAISPDNSSLESNSRDDDDVNEEEGSQRSGKRQRSDSMEQESPVRKLEAPRNPNQPMHHGALMQSHQYPNGPPSHPMHYGYRHGMYPPHMPPPPYGHALPRGPYPPPPPSHLHAPYGHYPPQGPPPTPYPHYPLSHLQSYKETIRVSGLPKSLSFRKICSKCGRTRAEHGELGFGNKCTFRTCGKCGADCKLHALHKTQTGILCTLTVDQGATPGAAEAFDRKIRALAARAELQKTILEDKKVRTEKLAHQMVDEARARAMAA